MSKPAFGTIVRITGGSGNNFQNHRRLSESRSFLKRVSELIVKEISESIFIISSLKVSQSCENLYKKYRYCPITNPERKYPRYSTSDTIPIK
jgi:hypothetical protein